MQSSPAGGYAQGDVCMVTEGKKYFISYARVDSDFALQLAKNLRAAGAIVWVDQLDIVAGERWDKEVESALHECRGIIVILSPASIQSNNVMDEVSWALGNNKLIVPVLASRCEIPFRLQRLQRADFTVSHDAGFAELCRALGVPEVSARAALGQWEKREQPTSEPADRAAPVIQASWRQVLLSRSLSAGYGLLLGVACGFLVGLVMFIFEYDQGWGPWAAYIGVNAVAGAIAGAVCNNQTPRARVAIIVVAAILVLAVFLFIIAGSHYSGTGVGLLSLGVPLGAISGALGRLVWERLFMADMGPPWDRDRT